MVKEWTNAQIEQLIELYRQRPCLWKLNDDNYTNKNVKNKAYEEIVAQFRDAFPTVDQSAIKNKIQNFRSSFRKELKKVDASERSGKGEFKLNKHTLWYYELLSFTKDQERPLSSISNLDYSKRSDNPQSSMESNAEACGDEPIPTSQNERSSQQKQAEKHDQVFKEPQTKKTRTKEIEKDLSTFIKTCTTALNTPSTSTDDCAALGTYVSEKLCKMEVSANPCRGFNSKSHNSRMKKLLTDYTDLFESPPTQLFVFPYNNTNTEETCGTSYGSPHTENSTSSSSLADYYAHFGPK